MKPMAGAARTRRTNEEWLQALQAEGEEAAEAQEQLRGLVAGALRKATAKSGTPDEATLEDLTQIALLKVLDKLDRFEGRSAFTTWAYSVAVRAAFGELRKSQYRAVTSASEEQEHSIPDESADTTGGLEKQEMVDVLYRVIEEDLTEKQRTAILGELRGTPQDALIEELGTNQNALYKLLHDARVKLRNGLEAAGISDHEVRETFDL